MQKVFEKIIEKLEERTSFLSECTKYGNKDAEQQNKSYSTMMMYEVADLVDDLIEIVKQEAEKIATDTNVGSNGWIPVSERLPEEHKQYDITFKNSAGIHSDSAIYNPYLKRWLWDADETELVENEILAWAEKREPYQPKGE